RRAGRADARGLARRRHRRGRGDEPVAGRLGRADRLTQTRARGRAPARRTRSACAARTRCGARRAARASRLWHTRSTAGLARGLGRGVTARIGLLPPRPGVAVRDARQLWQAVLAELQLVMTRAHFDTYFKETWAVGQEEGALVVGVKNPFLQETLEQRFAGLIRRTLADVAGEPLEVRLVTQAPLSGARAEAADLLGWAPAAE